MGDDRKKRFSSVEKDLFLNIIQKYDAILTSKETNGKIALRKRQSWEKIAQEFNNSYIVAQKASTKQLKKFWYNMKAKSKDSKTTENIIEREKEVEFNNFHDKNYENVRSNKEDILKYKILEEELEHKKKLHEEELKIKILEREHKEHLFKVELEIKLIELKKIKQ